MIRPRAGQAEPTDDAATGEEHRAGEHRRTVAGGEGGGIGIRIAGEADERRQGGHREQRAGPRDVVKGEYSEERTLFRDLESGEPPEGSYRDAGGVLRDEFGEEMQDF